MPAGRFVSFNASRVSRRSSKQRCEFAVPRRKNLSLIVRGAQAIQQCRHLNPNVFDTRNDPGDLKWPVTTGQYQQPAAPLSIRIARSIVKEDLDQRLQQLRPERIESSVQPILGLARGYGEQIMS